ncbi:DNA repair protein XRCC4 isoform X1 [Hippocampus comes]|uniref:DNA repair protein XRCC4 isoform X1 n=1 Tax=Hippocampus comes TaxID=109280 RepID=UPI00094E4994|nr:PREDICTED: DNA repair protein XRCC4 isoform X1 [Hippocampus comes]XP_019733584.1 PREDICTED: DNA repair protein XRCC4 isoform X1 [Hippocampus comes]
MSGEVRQIAVATDPRIPYFLRVDFAGNLGAGFALALSDGISAWNGEVSEDEVRRKANEMEVPMESFVEDLHQALIGGGRARGGGRRARDVDIYSFELTLDRRQFSYHKICGGVPVHLGSLKLQPAPHPSALTRELIGQSLKRNSHLMKENSLLSEENRKLKEDHAHILQELEHQVQDKETMTRDLYARFVLVLNEKKAKIRSLQDALSQLPPTASVQKKQRENDTSSGEYDSPDRRVETIHDSHPSLEPTIITTGHNQVSQGFSLDHTVSLDENAQARWKVTETLADQRPGTSKME